MKKYVVDPDELDELHGPVKIIFVLLRKVKVYNFIRRMKVKVYNLVRHTWLIVADDLLMLGLSSFRRKLFDFQAFHNQAHIINLSGIIIYFCGTYYLYAQGGWSSKYSQIVQLCTFTACAALCGIAIRPQQKNLLLEALHMNA